MPKIPPAFRGIERPNERSDTSVQSFDCALGSLAQASLDGMERQLDGVKIRRILRQVSEACANTPESLLDPSDLVEGHIVSHHNVSMLERRRQTLLDVSQECFAVHGPLNEHRSHDASLTQASNKRYRLPVPHGRVCDQASPTLVKRWRARGSARQAGKASPCSRPVPRLCPTSPILTAAAYDLREAVGSPHNGGNPQPSARPSKSQRPSPNPRPLRSRIKMTCE